ncbi:hypothetical protein STEG23_028460 [Scotinomys teguina]
MTVTPLGWNQDCSLKIPEPDVPASWFLDPGGWSKTTVVRLYFIFPGICTLSLKNGGSLFQNCLKPETIICCLERWGGVVCCCTEMWLLLPPLQLPCRAEVKIKDDNRLRTPGTLTGLMHNLREVKPIKVSTQTAVDKDDSRAPSPNWTKTPTLAPLSQAKMGRRQCKSAYNIIKNKTTPESSPPPTPKSDYCNADKAEENDLKKSLMKMLEEAFEEKMKNVSKEIGENTNKKLEEINKEIEEKKSKKLEEMNNEIEEKKNKKLEEMNNEIEEKKNKRVEEMNKEIEEKETKNYRNLIKKWRKR